MFAFSSVRPFRFNFECDKLTMTFPLENVFAFGDGLLASIRLRAVVLPPSHFLILESFHSPLPLLAPSVVLVHESSHHITPLVATPLFLVHESSHSSILPPIFSSAMPYFAFFSLFLNALLNDTFHPLLGILALLFCITPLARLSPCFHSREKTSVSEGSTWYVRIVSK